MKKILLILLIFPFFLAGCGETVFSLNDYQILDKTNFKKADFCIISFANNPNLETEIQRVLINSPLGNYSLSDKFNSFKDGNFIQELSSTSNKVVFLKYVDNTRQNVDVISLIYSDAHRYQIVTEMSISVYNTAVQQLLDSFYSKLTPEELDRYFSNKCD